MQEAKVKDGILEYLLANHGWGNTANIYRHLEMEHSTITTLANKIAADGYIQIEPTASFKVQDALLLHLLPPGKYFMSVGGYVQKERKRKYSKNWNTIQNAIIAITAVGTLLVGISQCAISNKTSELEKQIEILKSK
jgi:hypothetical protein